MTSQDIAATPDAQAISRALERATAQYFDDCRARIPLFVDRHFRYPGAIATNRSALGWDLLRAPLNLLWAPIYTLACLVRYPLRGRDGKSRLYRLLARTPAGFTTRVQSHISDLVLRELLNHGQEQQLLERYWLAALEPILERQSGGAHNHIAPREDLAPLLRDAMAQYQVTRTASADIGNSLSCTVLGAFAFQKFTPGGFGIAFVAAAIIARWTAEREFIFGSTLGQIYYGLFPPQPSFALTTAAVVLVLSALSALAAMSGLITDPIQAALGLHQRRLRKMLNQLEADLRARNGSNFRPKDQFIARLLDGLDAIKSGLS